MKARFSACRAFAPGSIGNLACGFDVLGLALEGPGDEVLVRRSPDPGLHLVVEGPGSHRLPRDPRRNTAGAAALAFSEEAGADLSREGIHVLLLKGLPLSSGMGGSAASAVATVVALDGLLGTAFPREALLRCALEGERVAAGTAHPDNAAPSLCGGLVLVPPWEPLRIIELEAPEELWVAHVHPHLEVETSQARQLLGSSVPLERAVAQWANTAALMVGLFRRDWDLIARAVEDRIAEPLRAPLVPGFHRVKEAASDAGALAASLSGSGPSVFALCRGRERAEAVAEAMARAFRQHAQVECGLLVSSARAPGARILETTP